MNEAALFESLGRKQAQLEAQDAAYTDLLRILARVQSGDITPDRLSVDLAARRWTVAPEGFAAVPAEPKVEA